MCRHKPRRQTGVSLGLLPHGALIIESGFYYDENYACCFTDIATENVTNLTADLHKMSHDMISYFNVRSKIDST